MKRMTATETVLAITQIILAIILGIWNYRLNKKINQSKLTPNISLSNAVYVDFDNKMDEKERKQSKIYSKNQLNSDMRKILEN